MGEVADGVSLLRRTGYPVPVGVPLSADERAALVRYGYWLEALADGRLPPTTPDQERFVGVARGQLPPATVFESAWDKIRRCRVPDRERVRIRLAQLASSREASKRIEAAYRERQTAVLAKVRKELLALRDEYGPQLVNARLHIAEIEGCLRELVMTTGESVGRDGVRVVYSRGRVTWDGNGLDEFCETHPEVEQFRRVGEPTVCIRYTDDA